MYKSGMGLHYLDRYMVIHKILITFLTLKCTLSPYNEFCGVITE